MMFALFFAQDIFENNEQNMTKRNEVLSSISPLGVFMKNRGKLYKMSEGNCGLEENKCMASF
jgi:hypothetical protein